MKIAQAEELPLPHSDCPPLRQAVVLVHLHLPSSSSLPPSSGAESHYRPLVALGWVADHRPRHLPPHTTVLIRLTGFALGPPPWPAPGRCGESGAVDGGGKGECGGGGGMDVRAGYWAA